MLYSFYDISGLTAINFGNPFEEKRGGSIVPEKYESQRPSTPPSSPSRDDVFDLVEAEGEGEAAFSGKVTRNPRQSPSLNIFKHAKVAPRADQDSLEAGNDDIETFTPRNVQPPSRNQSPLPQKARSTEVNRHRPISLVQKPAPPVFEQQHQNQIKPAQPKKPGSSDGAQIMQHAHAPTEIDLQNPKQHPQIKLPPGWVFSWSKSQKRWYFFNTTKNKSVWEWPPQV